MGFERSIGHVDNIPACSSFADNSPQALYSELKVKNMDVAKNPQKGDSYADIAEIYLCVAAKKANEGDVVSTRIMLEGGDADRRIRALQNGVPRGYDGAKDAVKLARQNGAEPINLHKLEIIANDLDQWVNDKSRKLAK